MASDKELIEQLAKDVDAIVHSDGNIFFTNHVKLEAFAKAYQAETQGKTIPIIVNVSQMKESNGNQWWSVWLSKTADAKAWDGHQVYTDKIEGRAHYEAACLRHFFGQCEKPNILEFDTDPPINNYRKQGDING